MNPEPGPETHATRMRFWAFFALHDWLHTRSGVHEHEKNLWKFLLTTGTSCMRFMAKNVAFTIIIIEGLRIGGDALWRS